MFSAKGATSIVAWGNAPGFSNPKDQQRRRRDSLLQSSFRLFGQLRSHFQPRKLSGLPQAQHERSAVGAKQIQTSKFALRARCHCQFGMAHSRFRNLRYVTPSDLLLRIRTSPSLKTVSYFPESKLLLCRISMGIYGNSQSRRAVPVCL